MSGIFSELRVIELSADVTGSMAGQICADRAAEVIKIEPPGGDVLRHVDSYDSGESKLYESLNRGKQSVVLDYDQSDGLKLVKALCDTADVVIASQPKRPLPSELSYETLKIQNSKLVYLDINAFGRNGNWADSASNDLVMQAYAGNMLSEGKTEPDQITPRAIVSTQMSEYVTAFYALLGISSALYHRARTGVGQEVSTSKLLTMLSIQSARIVTNDLADKKVIGFRNRLLELRTEGASLAKIKSERGKTAPRVINAFYRPYQTRDGAVFVGALTRNLRDKARGALNTTLLGRDDPNYNTRNDEYYDNALRQQAEIEAYLKEKTTEEWIGILEASGVPTGEITFPEDLYNSEQLLENSYIAELDHTSGRQIHVMPHAQFSAFPDPEITAAPSLGRDTTRILSEIEND